MEAFVKEALAALSTWSRTPAAGRLAGDAFGCIGDSYPAAAIAAADDLSAMLASISTPAALAGADKVEAYVLHRVEHQIEEKLSQVQRARVSIGLTAFDRAAISLFCAHVCSNVQQHLEGKGNGK